MSQRKVLQSGVTSAINTIRAFSVDSNPLVERLGTALVEGLVSRYLRRQHHHPIATDWALDRMFDIWLEKATALHLAGTPVPIVSVADKYGFTPLATGKGLCILFDGAPGTGKTWLGQAIATKACEEGIRTRWTTYPVLCRELLRLKADSK